MTTNYHATATLWIKCTIFDIIVIVINYIHWFAKSNRDRRISPGAFTFNFTSAVGLSPS